MCRGWIKVVCGRGHASQDLTVIASSIAVNIGGTIAPTHVQCISLVAITVAVFGRNSIASAHAAFIEDRTCPVGGVVIIAGGCVRTIVKVIAHIIAVDIVTSADVRLDFNVVPQPFRGEVEWQSVILSHFTVKGDDLKPHAPGYSSRGGELTDEHPEVFIGKYIERCWWINNPCKSGYGVGYQSISSFKICKPIECWVFYGGYGFISIG